MNRSLIPLLVMAGVIFVSGCTAPSQKDYTSFTQCIKDSEIQEYGAYWCPNCARVRLILGDAHKTIDYVECDPKCTKGADGKLPDFCQGHESQTSLCLEKGISKYPSFLKGDQILYVGTDMERLSEASGCSI